MKKNIQIGGKSIGKGNPAFIIAEIGSNHDRDLGQAKRLIELASANGADAVKFQIFKAESFYKKSDPMFNVMKENELPREWVKKLDEYAADKGVMFLASPFDKDAVDLLEAIKTPAIKWASSETVNLSLLRYAAGKKRPMLISTGMCNLADIHEAVETVISAENDNIVLLQSTSAYPLKPEDANLYVMDTLRDIFGFAVGYSDHTLGYFIAAAAVARGACVIEKHFTLSRKLKGPDHSYALQPDEFGVMAKVIREIEHGLGSPVKKMLPAEKIYARRDSIISRVCIPMGVKLTMKMIEVKRPALGIEPRFLKAVIGQAAKRNIKKNEPITWDMI